MSRRRREPERAPVCRFCGRSDVGFVIFAPRFKPFGTACVECESTLPADAVVPPEVKS